MQPKIVVTGGTGLVGRRLIARLPPPVLVLSRRPPSGSADGRSNGNDPAVSYLQWDAASPIAPETLGPVRAVINLAGDPVAEGRWTTEKKQRIRDSRVIGSRCLVRSLAQLPEPPEVLISASAVGYYGHRPGVVLTEDSAPGEGFLPEVCCEWEAEAEAARSAGIRVCRIRIGIVLDPAGGALGKMLPLFRWGLGGTLGLGRQYFPWIHVDDLVGLILHCLTNSTVSGPVNAVAPTATTNATFTRALAKVLHRPALLPAPQFGLQIAFGEFGKSLFDNQQIEPTVALRTGYPFKHGTIDSALRDLLK